MSYYCPVMGRMPIDTVTGAMRRAGVSHIDLRRSPFCTLAAGPCGIVAPAGLGVGIDLADTVQDERCRCGRTARVWRSARERFEENERITVIAVLLGAVGVTFAVTVYPSLVPWAAYLPLVVLSGTLHSPRRHAAVLGATVAVILLASAMVGDTKPDGVGAVIATLGVGTITLWRSFSRSRVGVQGSRGEVMLSDLRERLLRRAQVPILPYPWGAQTCVRSAYSQRFSGDFIVTRRTDQGRLLEVVLVDVSGKGLDAGTRAMVLSGAFDGLLGSVAPADFLTTANDYLIRQGWDEGFATAVHLCLDLHTGEYIVSGAGHPPPTAYRVVEGAWRVVEGGSGPVLGLLPNVRYPQIRGRLGRGDAMLLYTDGLIEDRGSDLDEGIARLVGRLDGLSGDGFSGVVRDVCEVAPAGRKDDRGAVLVWCG